MANIAYERPKFLASPSAIDFIPGKEAASQSFKDGDLLYPVSGLMTICADDTDPLFMAIAPATGVTSAACQVAEIKGKLLIMNTYEASNPGTKYLQALVGDGNSYDIKVSSGKMYVDLDDTTGGIFQILALLDTAGDAYGRVLCRVV